MLTADFISVILEMCDFSRATPNIYNPIPNECYSNTFANINGLQSNREYRFRLAATSSHGEIIRSDYVSVKTHKDRYENAAYYNNNQASNYQQHAHPQQQYAPPQEARVPTPTQLQRLYDDDEVVEIGWKYHGRDYENVSYVVEAASLCSTQEDSKQDWRVCYKGTSTRAAIQDSNLCLFRVQSVNTKRQAASSWSDTLMVKRHAQRNQQTSTKQSTKVQQQTQQSTPVPAVKLVCSTPKFSQIKAHSAKVTWKAVPDPTINRKEQQANELSDVTVASPTNSLIYELQRVDKHPMIIYSGNEFEYELKNLRPVEHIQVRLRAILLDAEGKRQEGEWSAVGFACTLCDVSSPPLNLQVQQSSSDSPTTSNPNPKKQSMTLGWEAPAQINGSSIQDSSETTFTITKLAPAEHYIFHVVAVNEAGISEKSNEVEYESPASVPDTPEHVTAEPISTSEIRLNWSLAKANGSEMLNYVITVYKIVPVEGQKSQKLEVDELMVEPEEDSVLVNGLETETSYEFTIEAENAIGKSSKERIRSATLSPPPEPPILSLSQAAANTLKLKWTPFASTSTAAYYYLEKENENGTFSPVYEGELRTAKVKGLKERSVHQFRIRAALGRGVMLGAWSSTYAFNTIRQPPNGIKTAPVVTELSPGVFQVEWSPVRCAIGGAEEESSLVYRLQTSSKLGRDKTGALEPWKTVYEGPSTMCTLPLAGASTTRQAQEESVSVPSPIAVLSTIRTPTDLSPKKRAKPNASAQGVNGPRTAAGGVLGRQMSSTSSTGPHHKVSLYRKLKKFASWLKKTISEKDCALIVLAIFVFLAVGIAVFLNSYYEF
uniref:Fibronectin type-III domain-containing protein n=1 Tax=Ditylenchus dipsaci TaxID=166011 RepID=A0A915CYF8_9BILA